MERPHSIAYFGGYFEKKRHSRWRALSCGLEANIAGGGIDIPTLFSIFDIHAIGIMVDKVLEFI